MAEKTKRKVKARRAPGVRKASRKTAGDAKDKVLGVKLTAAEHKRLQKEAGGNMSRHVRRALFGKKA